ncbi:cytochrome P450 [Streptomyces sp. NPDC005805]|uniref:cytochrome P450 n=1 Tax=Streptomyces sp. NPDC005805 TaxID=3157068 RepID=UPI0033E76B04
MTAHPPISSVPGPPPGCPAHGGTFPRRIHEETEPARMYEELRREHGPVAPVLLHGDIPAWIVLGYRENLEVMRTPSKYSRDSRVWSAFRQNQIAPDSPLMPMVGWQPLCVFADGEPHARLRGAVIDGLGQFNRRGMRRYVTHYTRELVNSFGPGTADLVRDYAEPLPMLVVSRLLGIAPDESPSLVEPTLDLMRGSETAAESNDQVTRVLQQLVAEKRRKPGNDLASRLISHEAALTEAEIVEHLRLTLVAAHQNTSNLIVHTLHLVLTDNRFRGGLSGGRMTMPDALEQILWDKPSIGVIPGRWATGDTTLGGKHIRAGDMLLLCIAAANVDPDQRPDLSTPMHGNRSHLSFGAGPHECPGGDIGRAIADTGIEELLALLPDLSLAVPESELGITANWLSSRTATLPVEFTPPASQRQDPAAARTPAAPLPPAAAPPAPAPAAAAPGPGRRRSWWSSILR